MLIIPWKIFVSPLCSVTCLAVSFTSFMLYLMAKVRWQKVACSDWLICKWIKIKQRLKRHSERPFFIFFATYTDRSVSSFTNHFLNLCVNLQYVHVIRWSDFRDQNRRHESETLWYTDLQGQRWSVLQWWQYKSKHRRDLISAKLCMLLNMTMWMWT